MIPGPFAVGICGVGVAVPQGFDRDGLARAAAGAPADRAMLRPEALKGRAIVIDPASALAANLAARFRQDVFRATPPERLGVVVASRHGSATAARDFADRVRRGSSAPAAFAAAGYNAAAGFSAMASRANGPSLAVAGRYASLRLAVQRACLYVTRGDADAMMVIACESYPDGRSLALGLALRHPEAAPIVVSDADLVAGGPVAPSSPFAAFPWLWPGAEGPFHGCLPDLTETADVA